MVMSKITNINATPMVSPKEAILVALKDGKMARTSIGDLISIVEQVQNMNIHELTSNFDTIKSNFENLETYLKGLDAKMQSLETRINKIEEAAKVEDAQPVEETPKAKTTKKSKKSTEAAE